MNEEQFNKMVERKELRPKQIDIPRIRSILASAMRSVSTIKMLPLNETTSTTIFKETYDALRQICDADLLLKGYESRGHEISITIFCSENIAYKPLERFREIRNDAQYRGYLTTIEQTREILEFWNKHGEVLISELRKKAKEN